MTNRRAVDDYNDNVVDQFDIPVLNIRDASYKNAIIIRELNRTMNRNDLLNKLVVALKLNEQLSNVFGLLFFHENESSHNSLAIVFILRNVKRFFNVLRSHNNWNNDLFYIRIDGSLKEIVDIKCTSYSLVYLKDDPKRETKCMTFDNKINLNLHMVWNLFGDELTKEADEIASIIVTKDRIFINCKSEVGFLKLHRSLLLSYGTDFDLNDCEDNLVLLRKNYNGNVGVSYSNDIKVVLNN